MILSELGKELSKALDRIDEWDISSNYVIEHKPSKTYWWIANGVWFFKQYKPEQSTLGFLEKIILWRKVKTLRNRIVANMLRPFPH